MGMAGVRISFSVVDATAKTEAAYNSASAQPWVDYNTLKDGLGLPGNDDPSFPLRRWATGEPNLFKLSDYRLFPSDGAPGYWSGVMSGADGTFSAAPVLTATMENAHSSIGVTVCFDQTTHLSDFKVDWIGAEGAVISTVTVSDNDQQAAFVDNHVDNYYGLRITAIKTDAPYRYVKIQEIDYGQNLVYNDNSLVDAKIVDEVDLSGASVPAGELNFEVLDPDDRLNPLNPDGIYAYMVEGIPVHVDCTTESETFPAGIYYMTAWEGSGTGTAKMQAVNIVGTQTEKTYESRFYSAVSPWDALKDIAAVLGVSSSAAGLPIETLTGYIPAVPVQDAIAHISVASGGFARVTRWGDLEIVRASGDPLVIAEEDVLGDPVVTQLKQPGSFEAEVNAYTISSTGYMTGINFDALLGYPVDAEFTQSLAFVDSAGQPVMIADAAPVSTQNVIDYRVCADRVDITRTYKAGSVSYRDKQVTVGAPQVVTVRGAGAQTVSIKSIPFITQSNYQAVLSAMQAYYGLRRKITLTTPLVYDLTCGARVSVPTAYGRVVGIVTRIDIDLSGGLLADVEVLA